MISLTLIILQVQSLLHLLIFKESSGPIADFTSSLIEISKECIPQTLTKPTKINPRYNDDLKKQLNSANQLYLNSKDLQIPTISMTSKYLELKPVEQFKCQIVKHGDHMFRKSIIKHLLKSLGYIEKNLWKPKSPSYTHLNRVGTDNKATSKKALLTL